MDASDYPLEGHRVDMTAELKRGMVSLQNEVTELRQDHPYLGEVRDLKGSVDQLYG